VRDAQPARLARCVLPGSTLGGSLAGVTPPYAAAALLVSRLPQHLALPAACLVHKDLALWNILGTSDRIAAFIDFDDAVGGDQLDDISLLGCFHNGAMIAGVLAGYATVRPLPADYRRRFWLHLLRNMIWKAVIRVGAGYFERTSGFFLVGAGASGADLRAFTLARIATALRGLRADADPVSLS
jgi:aminoglycoside phosphotransferase (APT) family kinase protein